MHVSSRGPSLDFRDEDEAEAFANHLDTMIRLAYRARDVEPPWVVRAARDSLLNAGYGADRGRMNAQVTGRRGPSEAAPGHDGPLSDQPARLTVSVNEAATLGDVHARTVRKWIACGAVEAVRGPRGTYRVDMGSLADKIYGHESREEDE